MSWQEDPESISGGQFALRAVVIVAILLVIGAVAYHHSASTRTPQDAPEAVEAASASPTPTPAPGPSGGDYHSTVFRARRRTLQRLEESSNARRELQREEEAFGQKSTPASQP